jgi:hypothetical protein
MRQRPKPVQTWALAASAYLVGLPDWFGWVLGVPGPSKVVMGMK